MTRREELIEQYRILYESDNGTYRAGENRAKPTIAKAFHELAMIRPRIESLLDYGCGRSGIGQRIAQMWPARVGGELRVTDYDPGIPGIDSIPGDRFDAVLCCDVMEHIPEEDVIATLEGIWTLSTKAFFTIATVPAVAILANGENAHCTVKNGQWWDERVKEAFGTCRILEVNSTHIICATWP